MLTQKLNHEIKKANGSKRAIASTEYESKSYSIVCGNHPRACQVSRPSDLGITQPQTYVNYSFSTEKVNILLIDRRLNKCRFVYRILKSLKFKIYEQRNLTTIKE